MPGPYRVVEGCAGVGWFRAIFVGGGGGKRAGRACPAPTGVMVVGAVYFQHPAHVNVENACNFFLIIIV